MNFYFIRHGEIASNRNKVYSGRSDEGLTRAGREQVGDAVVDVEKLNIDAIFCSPLKGTAQTAEIIFKGLKRDVPVRKDDSFNEIMMGPWGGMAESDVASKYPDEWRVWNTNPADLMLEGRETLAQLQARVLKGLRDIENQYRYNKILVVTHVAIIRVISIYATNSDLNTYKTVAVNNAQLFEFENLSNKV